MSEARRKRESNLIPNSERRPEKLRKIGRRGGIKSGKSRRKNAQTREVVKILAEEYLSKNLVLKYLDTINKIVVQVEIALWEYLPGITDGKKPWQNTFNN